MSIPPLTSRSTPDTADLERALNRHPDVARAAVVTGPTAGDDDVISALIVLGEHGSAEEILGWMRDPTTFTDRAPRHVEFRRSLSRPRGHGRLATRANDEENE